MTGDTLPAHLTARPFHENVIDMIRNIDPSILEFCCIWLCKNIIPANHDEILNALEEKGFADWPEMIELKKHVLAQKAEAEAKVKRDNLRWIEIQALMNSIEGNVGS